MFRILLIIALISLASDVYAGPRVDRPGGHRTTTHAATIDNSAYIDTDDLFMFVTNTGTIGRDLDDIFGFDYGTFFPFEHIDSITAGSDTVGPLYVAGLWVSGVDATTGDTLAAIAEYAAEFVPGPMANETFQTDNPSFRVYKLYADSLEDNPNADYAEWPVDQGAPLDRHDKPLFFGHRQYLWTVYNDANPSQHIGQTDAGETDPMGIEVTQVIIPDSGFEAWDVADTYLFYTIRNRGGRSFTDVYLTFWVDPDLGDMDDDLVGCDTIHQAMFCYNGSFTDNVYGDNPPVIGFRMFPGPAIPDSSSVAQFGPYARAGYRNIPVASFNAYSNGTDPDNYQETYYYQHGLDKSGAPYLYHGAQLNHRFSGNPLTGDGDFDETPGDKRMMASYGPLTLQPGDSQAVFVQMTVTESDSWPGPALKTLFERFSSPAPWHGSFQTKPTESIIDPTPDLPVEILVGGLTTADSVNAIRAESARLRGEGALLAPDSAVIVSSIAGFPSPALKLYFDRQAVIDQYPNVALLSPHIFTLSFNTDERGYVSQGQLGIQRVLMGDVTQDGELTLADVTYLVNYVFLGGPAPPLPAAADLKCDGSGDLTLTDITRLVNLIFLGASAPPLCPYWLGP